MFAEDIQLLNGEVSTTALRSRWISNPNKFQSETESLWKTMNTGGNFGFDAILPFNGSLFADVIVFSSGKAQLEVLLAAAEKDWSPIEPAIFGTLLERALDSIERSELVPDYTPRAYVERLVRPVVLETLRQD